MPKPNRGGLRNPPGGRPPKPSHLKRERCGDYLLPRWLKDWIAQQPEPGGHVIEKVLIEKFDLKEPKG